LLHCNCVEPAVAALAGRRIDPLEADELRFPLAEADHVFHKLLRRFRQEHIERLVCSAACGADILAIEAAEQLRIPLTVVLPFAPSTFRKTSVTDRPGNWGKRFDKLIETVHRRGALVELGLRVDDENSFSETNSQIIHSALSSEYHRKIAFVIWDGRSRKGDDSTAEFLKMALSMGFEKRSVLTKRRGQ
jgi:hypothetical protein